MFEPARLVVIMGVSGSGKSTVGSALGVALNVPFLDGDHYHTPEAVEKMRDGTALTDADRWPWFDRLAEAMKEAADQRGRSVTACSALKRSYRDYITAAAGESVSFILLHGSREVIGERQAHRPGHYMPASLLDSQFATLETPAADENVLILDVAQPVETLVATIQAALEDAGTSA